MEDNVCEERNFHKRRECQEINKYIVAELDLLKLEMNKIKVFHMVPERIILEPIGQLITQTSLNTMIQ